MVEMEINQTNEAQLVNEENKNDFSKPHGTTAFMHGGSSPIIPPNVTKDNIEMVALLFQMI
jgi:hypothetical protein